MNRLYGARGVISTTTWRRDNFTSDVNLFPDKVSDLRGAQLRVGSDYTAINDIR